MKTTKVRTHSRSTKGKKNTTVRSHARKSKSSEGIVQRKKISKAEFEQKLASVKDKRALTNSDILGGHIKGEGKFSTTPEERKRLGKKYKDGKRVRPLAARVSPRTPFSGTRKRKE